MANPIYDAFLALGKAQEAALRRQEYEGLWIYAIMEDHWDGRLKGLMLPEKMEVLRGFVEEWTARSTEASVAAEEKAWRTGARIAQDLLDLLQQPEEQEEA